MFIQTSEFMNKEQLQVANDTAYFPASAAFLRPRYPIDPKLSEPLAEALGGAYASTALLSLLILLLSFSLFVTAAGISRIPSAARRASEMQQLPATTAEPAVLTARVPVAEAR